MRRGVHPPDGRLTGTAAGRRIGAPADRVHRTVRRRLHSSAAPRTAAGLLIALLAALAAVLAPAAAGQSTRPSGDVFGAIADPEGDVVAASGSPYYESPDIRSVTAAYLDLSTDGPDDDVVQASAVVDAGPASGIEPRIYQNRVLAWWINGDGDPNTGSTEPGFGHGADRIVVAFGQSDGIPKTAWLRTWNGSAFAPVRAIPLVLTGNGFAWSLPAGDAAAARGRTMGVSVEAASIGSLGTVIKSDRAPDDGSAMLLPVPPPPPAVVTGSVAAVGPDRATVSGVVDDGGASAQWFVRYSPASGGQDAVTASQALPGVGRSSVSGTLVDLQPSTQYRYQLVVRSAWGESASDVQTFTTADPATQAGTVAVTGPARGIGVDRARLTGTVAVGAPATWWFEVGRTTGYGIRTPAVARAGGGTSGVARLVRGLPPGTLLHYRLVVVSGGIRYLGVDQRLRTSAAGRLTVRGSARARCGGAGCRLQRLSVHVSGRDPVGRRMTAAALRAGTRVRVRCLSACALPPRTVALRGTGPTLTADVAAALPGRSLPGGSVLEVRVVRPGYVGAVYRTQLTGAGARGRVCALSVDGRGGCAR